MSLNTTECWDTVHTILIRLLRNSGEQRQGWEVLATWSVVER